MLSCSPSDPVSSTGTGSLIPLPSRERGVLSVVLSCFTRLPCHPVVPAYAGMTVRDAGMTVRDAGVTARVGRNGGEGY